MRNPSDVEFSSATVENIPRKLFERWSFLLRIKKLSKQQCLLLLIEAYVTDQMTDELKAQFRAIYGLEE